MLMRFCDIWYARILRADGIYFTGILDGMFALYCMRSSFSRICINRPACCARGVAYRYIIFPCGLTTHD